MVKLLRIAKPFMPESFAFIMPIIFLETVSIYSMQSILPLLTSLNEFGVDYYSKIVTKLPAIFSIMEFSAMTIGAIFIDYSFAREDILVWPIIFWVATPIFLYVTFKIPFVLFLIRTMAILKGFIQPLILSVGAQVYSSSEISKIYHYFMFAYCAYQLGIYVVQSLVPINFIENNNCGSIDCMSLTFSFSSIAAVLACLIYINRTEYFTIKEESPAIIFKNEFYKILRILFVFIPYAIFWIFYQRINPQLTHLPTVINLLGLSANDIPKWYTILKILIVILYYNLFYKWFDKFILKHSTLLMTIGGILLGIWPIVAAPMVFEHKDQYSQVSPVKPDAIHIIYISTPASLFYIDIPYFVTPNMSTNRFVVHRDQLYVVRNNNRCPVVYTDYDVLNSSDTGERYYERYCFTAGHQYVFVSCEGRHAILPNPGTVRDSYGNPIVCAFTCPRGQTNEDMVFTMQRKGSADRSQLEYQFTADLENRLSYYSCQTIEPGLYRTLVDGCDLLPNFEAKPGGVYVLLVKSSRRVVYIEPVSWGIPDEIDWESGDVDIHQLIEPFKSTILDTRFAILYIIRAIGEVLLIINGFYFVYIQLHPKHRTIGLVLWFMLIKFGVMIYDIERYNLTSLNMNLYYLGEILICMAILFYILQLFFKFENGDQSN